MYDLTHRRLVQNILRSTRIQSHNRDSGMSYSTTPRPEHCAPCHSYTLSPPFSNNVHVYAVFIASSLSLCIIVLTMNMKRTRFTVHLNARLSESWPNSALKCWNTRQVLAACSCQHGSICLWNLGGSPCVDQDVRCKLMFVCVSDDQRQQNPIYFRSSILPRRLTHVAPCWVGAYVELRMEINRSRRDNSIIIAQYWQDCSHFDLLCRSDFSIRKNSIFGVAPTTGPGGT